MTSGVNSPTGVDRHVAPLRRTLGLLRPASGRVALATLLAAGAVGADIGLIGTAAWLISRAAQHPSEAALALAIVAVQCFGLSRGFFRYGERLVGHDAAFRLLAELRVQVYERLERLAPVGLPSFRRGDLLARIVRDVDSQQDLVIRVIPPFGVSVVVGVLTVAAMWWMLPGAAIILAVALVLAATVVPWLTGSLARRREARFAAVRGDLGAAMVDLTEGAAELVAFGAIGAQVQTIRERDAELTAIGAASAGTAGIGLALTTLLAGLACWGSLLVGIPAVISGRMPGTELAVITVIPLAAFELVVGLPVATQALQRVRQTAARVFEVTDAPVPLIEPESVAPLPGGPYRLEVSSVWAGYPGGADPALRGVDLSLPAGRRVAIVGPSGAGKSTLAAALLHFLAAQAGSITLGDTPIDRLAGADLRTVIGLVGQDAYLFDATIAENLAVGKRQATDDELRHALERVGLAGWLDDLPRGLGTQVGRHGGRLSGGQRQRIAVARALLADFPVLILDEPAEHLDPLAADALMADVFDVADGRSLVLITHRLAGLESVDEILVMEAGRVVERGTHDELLGRAGRYSDLWWEEMRVERGARSPESPLLSTQPDTADGITAEDISSDGIFTS
ncbi:MAG TPA: thiol reductant ABC exporter subunit CydC [Acidimicrobiales bacterium]|jgi:thiol reductant ABC exporter CydC subunit